MLVPVGIKLSPHEVLTTIGADGLGEVAINVLPPAMARHPGRLVMRWSRN